MCVLLVVKCLHVCVHAREIFCVKLLNKINIAADKRAARNHCLVCLFMQLCIVCFSVCVHLDVLPVSICLLARVRTVHCMFTVLCECVIVYVGICVYYMPGWLAS